MQAFGGTLFFLGALLLVVFAFFGVDVGGNSIMNLSGTLVGSAMMISGAVFIAGARIEQAMNGEPPQNPEGKDKEIKAGDRDAQGTEDTPTSDGEIPPLFGWLALGVFFLLMLFLLYILVS